MVSTVALTLINPPSPPILIVDSKVATTRKQGSRATTGSTNNKVATIPKQGNPLAPSSTRQVAINRVPISISNPMVQAHPLLLAQQPLDQPLWACNPTSQLASDMYSVGLLDWCFSLWRNRIALCASMPCSPFYSSVV